MIRSAEVHRSIRTGGILAVCVAAVLCLLEARTFLLGSEADRQVVAANTSAVLAPLAPAAGDLRKTSAHVEKITGEAEASVPRVKKGMFYLWKHADRTLGHLDQASADWTQQQGDIAKATVRSLAVTDDQMRKFGKMADAGIKLVGHADAVVSDPAIPRTFGNVDRGTARMADAADSGAKAMDHVEKKLNQWLNPVRTTAQKIKAGAVWALDKAARWFTR